MGERTIATFNNFLNEFLFELKDYNVSNISYDKCEELRLLSFRLLDSATNFTEKFYASYLQIRFYLLNCLQYHSTYTKAQNLFIELCNKIYYQETIDLEVTPWNEKDFIKQGFYLPYFCDSPEYFKLIHKKLNDIFRHYVLNKKYPNFSLKNNPQLEKSNKIRIGYIGEAFRNHSVGWLIRWLINNHSSDFEVFLYHYSNLETPLTFKEFKYSDKAKYINIDKELFTHYEVAKLIYSHNLDILIDLESITSSDTFQVLCFKPCKTVVSYLGWDSANNTDVDYYIADYCTILDESNYVEKILYTKKNYIAVEGFEVHPFKPKVFSDLKNKIVYLSTCTPQKRYTPINMAYLEIINQVKDSVLLVKSMTPLHLLQEYFFRLCQKTNTNFSSIYFLSLTATEESHRGILNYADIILDSYPYSGATTTLEALWMNLPVVTLIGKSFMSRNSYSFLHYSEIPECITENISEFKEKAIILGQSSFLRNNIRNKLLTSKKTNPLWNISDFVRDIESIYKSICPEKI